MSLRAARQKLLRRGLEILVFLFATVGVARQGQPAVLAAWEMNTATGYGASPYAPSTADTNLTVVGWTRSASLTTAGTAAARGWGATGWCSGSGTCSNPPTSETGAISAGAFVTTTLSASAGHAVSFSAISKLNYRRSSTGPTSGALQVQVGSGNFIDVASLNYSNTASTGAALSPLPIDLSGVASLQNVPAGTAVTFRVVNWGATNSGGTWYIFDVGNLSTSPDFEIQGTVTQLATQLNVETVAAGTGTLVSARTLSTGNSITVYAVARDASNSFIANVPAVWSLTSSTGGVVAADLVPASDGKSAVFMAREAGSTVIHAEVGGLTAQDSGVITVQGVPTPPGASGQAWPTAVPYSQNVRLEVGVVPGSNPTSTGLVVTGDLSNLGGDSGMLFYDDGTHGDTTAGDGIYSTQYLIGSAAPAGTIAIPITVRDAQGRTATTSISFRVLSSIAILHVNDTHARLTPHKWIVPTHDLMTPAFEDVGGAASMATAILQLAASNPNSLVIDAGDISEGNPIGDMSGNGAMTQFYGLLSSKLSMVAGRGGRGLDAVVVGNHDVRTADYIVHLMELQNAGVPVLSVNVRNAATHEPLFAPYHVVTINGTRVGILGYTTAAAEVGAELAGTVEVADCDWNGSATIHLKAWVDELRNNQHCDMVVLAAHIGHSAIATDISRDGSTVAALLVDDGVTKLPEIAVTGHWHTWAETVWQPASLNYKTIFAESGSYMHYVGEVQIDGSGNYLSSAQHVVRNSAYAADPDVQSLVAGFTAAYDNAHPEMPVDTVLGYTADNLMLDNQMKWWSADEYPWNGNNTAGQWICDAMQWKAAQLFGGCDLAIEAGGGVRADVPAGAVTYLQVYETFPWNDDTFYRISMTGQEILNFLTKTNCDAGFSRALHVVAHDGVPTSVTVNGAPLDPLRTYTVAINNYMYQHPPTGWTWSDRAPLTSTVLCRDGIVEYMQQFPPSAPYSVGMPRYQLDTEFAGQFRAVITMVNDRDSRPTYEDAFIRFLTATPETLIRRGSLQVPSALVNEDGTVSPTHRLSEIELYRSYLGFANGVLHQGDIIEVRGKGSFFGGNPEFVDQEGIYARGVEFNVVGRDASLAKPAEMPSIASFWDDDHKNHYVQFLARKAGTDTVVDQFDSTIKLWDATGFAAKTIPGSVGDLLVVTGVSTTENQAMRFRCDAADLASNHGINDFPGVAKVASRVAPLTTDNANGSVTLVAEAGPASLVRSLTPVADAQVASGRATSNYGTGSNIYLQSAATSVSSYGNERGWLRFDLSGLPADAVITSASLQLFCWKATGPAMDVAVHAASADAWTESGTGGITWNSQPGFAATALDTQTLAADDTSVWYAWDVTSHVQTKWAGNKLVSLLLKPVTEDSSANPASSYGFDAREYGSAMPVLRLTLQGTNATVAQTAIFYRYSSDNVNWTAWTSAGALSGAGGSLPFSFPQNAGYYEFYSVATDGTGQTESTPVAAQASVHHGISPAYSTEAIVSLGNLSQTYDGTPRNVSVTTVPPALQYAVTYNGQASVPVHAGSYQVAVQITQSGFTGAAAGTLVVERASQNIDLPAFGAVVLGAQPIALPATSSAGLPITYTSGDTSIAIVSGSTLTIVGLGTATITATQEGDADHSAATVQRDVEVTTAPPQTVPAMPVWFAAGLAMLLAWTGARRRRG